MERNVNGSIVDADGWHTTTFTGNRIRSVATPQVRTVQAEAGDEPFEV